MGYFEINGSGFHLSIRLSTELDTLQVFAKKMLKSIHEIAPVSLHCVSSVVACATAVWIGV